MVAKIIRCVPFEIKRSCVSWRFWNDPLSKTITARSGSLCNKSVLAHSWKTSESIEHSQSETENNFLFSIAPIALIRPFPAGCGAIASFSFLAISMRSWT